MSGIKELEIGVFLDFHGSDLFFVARPLRDLHSTKISPKTLRNQPSYSQMMIRVSFITETKRMGPSRELTAMPSQKYV